MNWIRRGLVASLVACSVVAITGCEDNEKASGIASQPSEPGAGADPSKTQEYYAKQAQSKAPSNYPGSAKYGKAK